MSEKDSSLSGETIDADDQLYVPTLKTILLGLAFIVSCYRFGKAADAGKMMSIYRMFTALGKGTNFLSEGEYVPADQWWDNAMDYMKEKDSLTGIPAPVYELICIAFPMVGLVLSAVGLILSSAPFIKSVGEGIRELGEGLVNLSFELYKLQLPKLDESGGFIEDEEDSGGFGGSINWDKLVGTIWNPIATRIEEVWNTTISAVESAVKGVAAWIGSILIPIGDVITAVGDAVDDYTEAANRAGDRQARTDTVVPPFQDQIGRLKVHFDPKSYYWGRGGPYTEETLLADLDVFLTSFTPFEPFRIFVRIAMFAQEWHKPMVEKNEAVGSEIDDAKRRQYPISESSTASTPVTNLDRQVATAKVVSYLHSQGVPIGKSTPDVVREVIPNILKKR